jgi:AcrR family transcriptional regulator
MLKPLTKEQTDSILRTAAEEFADKGFAGTAVSRIAKKAGVSVGVIYKYYAGKEALFNACVEKSLGTMEEVLDTAKMSGGSMLEMAEVLITEAQRFAKENPEYIRLYHQITATGSPSGKTQSAGLIESGTARLYEGLIKNASDAGIIRKDIDPAAFAFFFDNLMMMLHFSYACDYYKDRFRIYCGDDAPDRDAFIREQLMKFIGGALNG